MSHLKQTVLRNFTKISKNILSEVQDSKQLFLVRLNSPLAENLGETLYSLVLLVITPVLLVLVCILNLSLVIAQILMKLSEQLKNMGVQESESLYTSCRSEDGQKNTTSTYKRWRTSVLKEGGGSAQDSTLAYSEMPGALKENLSKIKKDGISTVEEYEKLRNHL